VTCKSSLYKVCYDRFADHPLAVKSVTRSGTVRSMVLMLEGPDEPGFFVLAHDFGMERPLFWLWSWPAGSIVNIEDGSENIPDVAMNAVLHGVPIPRDGSLFGWAYDNVITALIVVYAEYTPERPEPSWAIMPRADIPSAMWPAVTGKRLFGNWSWEPQGDGQIVSIESLIARDPGTVFWVDTKAILGSDCCAVAHDISSHQGYVLGRGSYVYYQALQDRKPVPSLDTLLGDPDRIDLAGRFRRSTQTIS
jgi:hypothetical protein